VKFVELSSIYTYQVVNETAYVPRFHTGYFIKKAQQKFFE